jgi:hypothetical protein
MLFEQREQQLLEKLRKIVPTNNETINSLDLVLPYYNDANYYAVLVDQCKQRLLSGPIVIIDTNFEQQQRWFILDCVLVAHDVVTISWSNKNEIVGPTVIRSVVVDRRKVHSGSKSKHDDYLQRARLRLKRGKLPACPAHPDSQCPIL